MTVIQAVYADGVLTPREPLNLPEGSVLDVVVPKPVDADYQSPEQWLDAMMNRTEAEVRADREQVFAASQPARKPPEGKTWADMVVGKWPGDETDEEIREFLEKLS